MNVSEIISLQSISGSNAKRDFIKERKDNPWFKTFLYYALNPLLTYNVSETTLTKLLSSFCDDGTQKLIFFKDIFECCEFLSRLRGIDDATLRQVCLLLSKYEDEERSIYIKLLSKSLRLGVTAKTINKIIPDLIPEWEIQQAFPIEKYPVTDGTEFWVSEKLNGNRGTFYKGKLLTRTGVAYTGLEHITDQLDWIAEAGFVLDGELTLKNKEKMTDNEAFRVATGILNAENVNKTGICFTIFDMIPIADFDSSEPGVTYNTRRDILDFFSKELTKNDSIRVLPILYHGTDISKIDDLLDDMVKKDKEGLMINLNTPYKRTRHKGILKVKRFYTMDLPILRCEEGGGRLKGSLGSIVLDYKGNEVKVGSGFSDYQREEYWKNRDELVGKICEVKYKEISKDKKTGLESLQFPVFVDIRTDKESVSFG